MITGNVLFSSVLVMFSCLFGSLSVAAEYNESFARDTSIIAKNQESFKIDSNKPFYQATLRSTGEKVAGNRKISLVLDDVKLKENPDGVYEIYVSLQPYATSELNPKKTSFAGVLDIYQLTEDGSKRTLTLDITKNLSRWVKDGSVSPHLVITILFRGNKFADNSESMKAGKLGVEGLRVVQAN